MESESNMTSETPKGQADKAGVVLTPEQQKSRRARNVAIGLAVALFMVLIYVITIVRLGGAVPHPPA